MKSSFFFTSLLLCFLFSAPLFAQDIVPLRVSERDGYSRLILGWTEKVAYKVDKSKAGSLLVTFDRNADLSFVDIDFSIIDNVASVNILSVSPLSVSFAIPKTSNVRDFKIGNRVVFDIYNPKDSAEAVAFKESKNKQASLNNLKPEDKVELKPVFKPEQEKPLPKIEIELVPETMPSLPLKKVKEEKLISKAKPHDKKKLNAAVKDENHVVSLRSIQSITVAAFESYGTLAVIVGGGSEHVIPTLNTANKAMFSKFKSFVNNDITAYYMPLPDNLNMKSNGAGLVWDLILGDKVKEKPPIKAKSSLFDKRSLHSGSVFIPLEHVANIVDVEDIITGQNLKVVTVNKVSKNAAIALSYVDFDVLRSPIGLAVRPKVDDLLVSAVDGGIEITRQYKGLSVSSSKDMSEAHMFVERAAKKQAKKSRHGKNDEKVSNNFFRFDEWSMGGADELIRNDNILLAGMKGKTEARRIEDLLALGKMYLSHGRGAEALGYFNYASSELPELEKSPEFKALRGLSKAMDWKSDSALDDFMYKGLKDYDEIKYWKSYVLADLGDWYQAAEILPDNYKPIYDYPSQIGNRLALSLIEVNLRAGRVNVAEELIAFIANRKASLLDPQKAALKYLQGEAYRQHGELDKTKKIWESLTQDKDDLYRTKARLALAILLKNSDEIKNDEVIDRLERLRYVWRGDELEAQIHYWLGKAYFNKNDFIKGLAIMRDAASVAGDIALGHRITEHMGTVFSDFYLKNDLNDVSPLDAVTLYEQFSELTPIGSKGDRLVQKLAEQMVRADLLGRATKLLRHQVNHRLKGKDKLRVAIRLAAIELIDKNPQKAINALGAASASLRFISDKAEKEKRMSEIALLKIRAYSQNKQFDKALSLLENVSVNPNVNRLKADIAWKAGYWDEASEALDSVIIDENISMTRPLSEDQLELILNRAVALSLVNDRIALANMRKKYSDLMLQTKKAHQFEVITRKRSSSALADRETLLSVVSEVDLFKKFLDSYRAEQAN